MSRRHSKCLYNFWSAFNETRNDETENLLSIANRDSKIAENLHNGKQNQGFTERGAIILDITDNLKRATHLELRIIELYMSRGRLEILDNRPRLATRMSERSK